jgi:hypothetical protein
MRYSYSHNTEVTWVELRYYPVAVTAVLHRESNQSNDLAFIRTAFNKCERYGGLSAAATRRRMADHAQDSIALSLLKRLRQPRHVDGVSPGLVIW